jgi:hypothetical protein
MHGVALGVHGEFVEREERVVAGLRRYEISYN